MANIEFNPEEQQFARPEMSTGESFMVRWVLKTGLVKDEKQANYVLLGLTVLFVILTFVVLGMGPERPEPRPLPAGAAGFAEPM